MIRKIILAVAALFISAAVFAKDSKDAKEAKDDSWQKGKFAMARLAYFEAGTFKYPKGMSENFDGTRFLLCLEISPKKADSGNFTMDEIRDILVGGKSFSKMTIEKHGENSFPEQQGFFEPEIEVYDSEDFFKNVPSLRNKMEILDSERGMIVKAEFYGIEIDKPCKVEARLNAGWSGKKETFKFKINSEPPK